MIDYFMFSVISCLPMSFVFLTIDVFASKFFNKLAKEFKSIKRFSLYQTLTKYLCIDISIG